MILTELRKWGTTIVISLSRYMTHKLDFFLTILAPGLVFMLINYNVWRAIYGFRHGDAIHGLSVEEMLHYQCAAFLIGLIVRSHRSWNLSEDIRHGRITAFLLYPFSTWRFHAAQFIATELIQLVTAFLAFAVMRVGGFLSTVPLTSLLIGVGFALLVSFLWFALEFLIGTLTFWLEETWMARSLVHLVAVFLSGAFIPLELFPPTLQKVLTFTPFPLLTSTPTQLLLGQSKIPLGLALLSLLLWTVIITGLTTITWKRGMKHYTGAGI